MQQYQNYYNEYREETCDRYDAFSETVNKMLGDGFDRDEAIEEVEIFEYHYDINEE